VNMMRLDPIFVNVQQENLDLKMYILEAIFKLCINHKNSEKTVNKNVVVVLVKMTKEGVLLEQDYGDEKSDLLVVNHKVKRFTE